MLVLPNLVSIREIIIYLFHICFYFIVKLIMVFFSLFIFNLMHLAYVNVSQIFVFVLPIFFYCIKKN